MYVTGPDPKVIYGPEYPKINTIFERDGKGIVTPDKYSTREIEYLADADWLWTEKIDGTNIRLFWNGDHVTIGGRTNGDSQLNSILIHYLMHEAHLTNPGKWHDIFRDDRACDDVTVYGEGFGKGIHAGGQYMDTQAFIIFDVRVGEWWLSNDDIADIAEKLGCNVVPFYATFSVNEAWEQVKKGTLKSSWENAKIEGLVGRPAAPLFDRKGDRIVAKIKMRDWNDLVRATEYKEKEAARLAEKEAKRAAYEARNAK